jgi:DNA-binding transcriptional MerR regulator
MAESLDIAAVVRLTGLTSRTLRHYEARGLLTPSRSYSGRRHYGPADLERIHQIVTLKRAGLSLAAIAQVAQRGHADFAALIDAQIAAVTKQAARLGAVRALLLTVKSRLERNESIDVATFCSLISRGEAAMSAESDAWQTLLEKYMSDEAKGDLDAALPAMATGFDQQDYADQWRVLGQRIKAALPMSTDGAQALGFVREWFALLAPFSAVATPAMWKGTQAMYGDLPQWHGKSAADPGFDAEVWRFIYAATEQALARGEDIGPLPPWMQAGQSQRKQK